MGRVDGTDGPQMEEIPSEVLRIQGFAGWQLETAAWRVS